MPCNTTKKRAFGRAVLAASLALALAAGAGPAWGSTQLGLRVTDSSQDQAAGEGGQPGSISLGIRVTDSNNPAPLTVKVTFDANDGTGATSQEVPYNAPVPEPADPSRDGYSFLGWFDAPSGGSLHDFSVPVTADTTLYAQWALQVKCSIPTTALVTVDASGKPAGEDQKFISTSVAPLKVSTVKSERLTGASSVFADQATLDGVRVTLKPKGGTSEPVEVPLVTTGEGQAVGFEIPAEGTLDVSFGLSLPDNFRLSYLESAADVAMLSYVIGPA